MATVVFKPMGNGVAWRHAMINSVSNDPDNSDNSDSFEFKIDHENHKRQIHVVFGKPEALTMTRDLIASLIETGHLRMIKQYVKDGIKEMNEQQTIEVGKQ